MPKNIGNWMIALAGLISACSFSLQRPQDVLALPFSVRASEGVVAKSAVAPNGTDFSPLSPSQSAVVDTGELQQGSVARGIAVSSSNNLFDATTASATARGTASLGSLSGFVIASTTGPSTNPGVFNAANASLFLGTHDTLTVTSPTIAVGTPVDLSVTIDLSVRIHGADHYFGGNFALYQYQLFDISGIGNTISFGATTTDFPGEVLCNGPTACSGSKSDILHAVVGETLQLDTALTLTAVATGVCIGLNCPPFTDGNAVQIFNPSLSSIDASHTANVFVNPITSGVSYTTASGVMYLTPASAVPEPSSLLLLGAGLAGLAAWRRKRAA